ncbi:MAG: sigma-70 family RNA polymerase sigma factor [Undibacterium sp.]|nr:sigma-70 family RNA polymerase sigma factor [Opitutaceae bacterium]
MSDKIQLQLRRYAESGADDAFAAVVQGCLPLVYRASLRRVAGDVHCAEDVTQLVFTALARNAAKLAEHPDITGWLFTTTRFLAAKTLRSQRRRQAREQELYMTQPVTHTDGESAEIPAVLDDVVMELRQLDRQVILLRFHRGMRLSEIGAQLAASENAVQKRLDRALEQLRLKLARQGVTSTATALALALGNQSAVAVPAGLAATATGAALACGAGSLLAGSSLMIVSKLQLGLAAAIVAVASSGFVWEIRENTRLRVVLAQRIDADVMALKQRMVSTAQHAESAEADALSLQRALRSAQATQSASPSWRELMDPQAQAKAAMARGDKLAQEGKLQEALDEYLAGYRGLQGQRGGAVWQQMLLVAFTRLGRTYPQALAAMRELRDVAMQKLAVTPSSRELMAEIGVLNERLGDTRASVALYDSLPAGHPGRQTLGLMAHKAFVETQRYADALIGKPPAAMMRELEMGMSSSVGAKGSSSATQRGFVISGALSNIEVLTGAGKLEEARMLTEKLLGFDNSEATRSAVEQRLARANSPRPTS